MEHPLCAILTCIVLFVHPPCASRLLHGARPGDPEAAAAARSAAAPHLRGWCCWLRGALGVRPGGHAGVKAQRRIRTRQQTAALGIQQAGQQQQALLHNLTMLMPAAPAVVEPPMASGGPQPQQPAPMVVGQKRPAASMDAMALLMSKARQKPGAGQAQPAATVPPQQAGTAGNSGGGPGVAAGTFAAGSMQGSARAPAAAASKAKAHGNVGVKQKCRLCTMLTGIETLKPTAHAGVCPYRPAMLSYEELAALMQSPEAQSNWAKFWPTERAPKEPFDWWKKQRDELVQQRRGAERVGL